ncbi:hypothetical protein EYD10_06928 [Varanus komodoensis]|nr:hypothetical protein EYD10_06928 [Varanus komodoensis]
MGDTYTTLFFPSFHMNSYLELPSLELLSGAGLAVGQEQDRMVIYLTVKTTALSGTLLYTSDDHSGEHFLHLYLEDGRPAARLGCGASQDILTVTVNHSISRDAVVPITVRAVDSIGLDRQVIWSGIGSFLCFTERYNKQWNALEYELELGVSSEVAKFADDTRLSGVNKTKSLHTENVMSKARLGPEEDGLKIGKRGINHLRHADDTV